ncbi:MAG: DUF4442 domain-containing protein [Tsuneonella sp.]
MSETEQSPKFAVAFVERTGLRRRAASAERSELVMPLAGNENHVGVMYLGALTVLAEAVAATPGIALLDPALYFPIIKDIYVDFHRMAASDVAAEFGLPQAQQDELLADLQRKGSAGYVAEFPMRDNAGTAVATARVTVKLLSHNWPPKGQA